MGDGDPAWVWFDCREEDWKILPEFGFEVVKPSMVVDFGDHVNLSAGITEWNVYSGDDG